MRRMLHIDWRTWLAFAFALLVIFIVVDRERVANTNEALIAETDKGRVDAARERDRLLDGQRRLQSQVDRLSDQNAALVDLFEQTGGRAPPSLIGSRTVIEQDDNDDNDGDTIVVPKCRYLTRLAKLPTRPNGSWTT